MASLSGGTFQITYQPLAGTVATLVDLDQANQVLATGTAPGNVTWVDENNEVLFNPKRYKMTLPDGRAFTLNTSTGLESMTDLNGYQLTLSSRGIQYANPNIAGSGTGVTFTRDGQGRITAIQDPDSTHPPLRYGYDGFGNLQSFTDRMGNTTGFSYLPGTSLMKTLTPAKPGMPQPIANYYDNSGRLIKQVDSYGNEIDYSHDLADGKETVVDRAHVPTVYQYDDQGNVTRQIDTVNGHGVTVDMAYDAFSNKVSETHYLNGRGLTTTYYYGSTDAARQRRLLLSQADPLGHTVSYTYDAQNHVLTTTDARQNTTTNSYDANGNLLTTQNPDGGLTQNTYDPSSHLLVSTQDAGGNVTTYLYDAKGYLKTETDGVNGSTGSPLGGSNPQVTDYTYDANGNRITETKHESPANQVTGFAYDSENRLVKTTYPDNTTTSTIYDELGKAVGQVDQKGRDTGTLYDNLGRPATVNYPDQTTQITQYDADGRPVTVTDRGGRNTVTNYDELGRAIGVVYLGGGGSTSTAYDDLGRVTATTDENQHTTTYSYDDAGRRTGVTDATMLTTTYQYDANGNQTQVTDASGRYVQTSYDTMNRPATVTYPDGYWKATLYDQLGRKTKDVDRDGHETDYKYDAMGRPVEVDQVSDMGILPTLYGYDQVGNETSQQDANNHVTTYQYDVMNRRIKRTLPGNQYETYDSYDNTGNLTQKTTFDHQEITYGYDGLTDRLLSVSSPNRVEAYQYDNLGRRTQMNVNNILTTFTYDRRDRVSTKTAYTINSSVLYNLQYSYDGVGNVTGIQTTALPSGASAQDGPSVNYDYDNANKMLHVYDSHLGTTAYGYDNSNNLQTMGYANGVSHTWGYDSRNRLTNLNVTGPTLRQAQGRP